MVNPKRIHIINNIKPSMGPVVYWMSRDQRVKDNWALIYAQKKATELRQPLIVVFCLVLDFLGANLRHYDFMLRGLSEVSDALKEKNITFAIIEGGPDKKLPAFLKKNSASFLVCDFDPLKIKKRWKEQISKNINISFHEVDAHNIVPCRVASEKQEYGAYTIRPKINSKLDEFLDDFDKIKKHAHKQKKLSNHDKITSIKANLKLDKSVNPVNWLKPGEKAAKKVLSEFINKKLRHYESDRNDPSNDAQSNLSPYLHFGHISAQRVALEVIKSRHPAAVKNSFLEELIVRRELSDNFCFYNENYDNFEGFPDWAKKTLKEHKKDRKSYTYGKNELEHYNTHDYIWNAAQKEMVIKGKMHGYMRMYWCKKILEWTKDIKEAHKIAIYLNDKYELDGRDPSGYTGIAWSLGGVHDRAWPQRHIYGKIRYMSEGGIKSKFHIDKYTQKLDNNILHSIH
jgi:deoxyribodipyrimidine photo-lyase